MGSMRRGRGLARYGALGGISVLFLGLALVFLRAPAHATPTTIIVNDLGDGPAVMCDVTCTLRDAVFTANATPSDALNPLTIVVPSGTYTLTQGVLTLGSSGLNTFTTVQGAGSSGVSATIINQTTPNAGVFATPASPWAGTTNFQNLEITGGQQTSRGGGALLNGDSPAAATFSNVVLTGNTAANAGGAISVPGGASVTITDSSIQSNTVVSTSPFAGGAIFFTGPGSLNITRTLFDSNVITNTGPPMGSTLGGALFISQAAAPMISLTTFTNNQADRGGAIYNQTDPLDVTTSRFVGNTAASGSAIAHGTQLVTANNNWWGTNAGPGSGIEAGVNATTWLQLRNAASPIQIAPGAASTLTADLFGVSGTSTTPLAAGSLDGLPPFTATFAAANGTFSTASPLFVSGTAIATFVGGSPGPAGVTATADGQDVNAAITVNPFDTTTNVVSSQGSTAFGQGVSFTATVTQTVGGAPASTGSVQFMDGTTALTDPIGVPTSGIVSTSAMTGLSVGTHSITALYTGDTTNGSSTANLSQVVGPDATSMVVTSSPPTSAFGQPVAFTATVTSTFGQMPGGSVDFVVGGTDRGPVALISGVATLGPVTDLPAGGNPVVATYLPFGDLASFTTSTGTLASGQVVSPEGTTTTVTSSSAPSVFGQPVTFTATVTSTFGQVPDGQVEFFVAGIDQGPVALSSGVATFGPDTDLALGNNSVTATYLPFGDLANFTTSGGILAGGQVVGNVGTTTGINTNLVSLAFGQPLFVTATVTATPPGAGTPSGTVSFFDNGNFVTTAPVTGGVATWTSTTLNVGTHPVSAVYGPAAGSGFNASTSPGQNVSVVQAGTTTTVTSDLNPSLVTHNVNFTATVTAVAPGGGTPVGDVQFMDGLASLGSPVTLDGNGVAAFGTASLPLGHHVITANFTGPNNNNTAPFGFSALVGNFGPSTGTLLGGQDVIHALTSIALTSSQPTSVWGQGVSFTATVTATTGPALSGTVQFMDGIGTLGSAVTLNAGVATTPAIGNLSVGPHVITAVYSGDGNFSGVTSGPLTQTVNKADVAITVTGLQNPSTWNGFSGPLFTVNVSAAAPGAGSPGTNSAQLQINGVNNGAPLNAGTLAAFSLRATALDAGMYDVTVVYAGNANFNAVTGTMASRQTVNQASTTTTLSSSHNPSLVGQAVAFTATVHTSAEATPTGTVQFFVNGVDRGSVSTTANVALSAAITDLPAGGPYTVTTTYFGGTNFNGNNGVMTPGQTVIKAPTTTGITSSQNHSVFGQGVTFTANVTSTASFAGLPGGTLNFWVDGVDQGPTPVTAGFATSTGYSALTVGAHTVTSTYNSDSSFDVSQGTLANGQTVDPANTTTALTSTPNPSDVNQTVVYTATVTTNLPGVGTPPGSVQFFADGTSLGFGDLSSNVATLSDASLVPGTHPVTATYLATTSFNASPASNVVSQVVNPYPTTTTMLSSGSPTVYGQPVIFTAHVASAGGIPTGTVQFSVDGVAVGQGVSLTVSGDAVSAPMTTLPVAGPNSVVATYLGVVRYATSASAPLVQTVTPASTTTNITSSQNPSVFGQPVTFTATVAPIAPGGNTPTGDITFFLDGQRMLPLVPLVNGQAISAPVSNLSVGTAHTMTATYPDTANYFTSNGSLPGGFQVVNKADATTTVTSSVNPSVFGQPVLFTVTTTALSPGAGTPTGQVALVIDNSLRQIVSLAGGTTTTVIPVTNLATGSHTVKAIYSGDGNFLGSTPGTQGVMAQVVNPADTTTIVTSAKSPTVFGEAVTFTATATATSPGAGFPDGRFQFFADNTFFGLSLPMVSGSAVSLPISSLSVGTHTVTATYVPRTAFCDAPLFGAPTFFPPCNSTSFKTSTGTLTGGQVVNRADAGVAVTSAPSPSVFGQMVTFSTTVTALSPGAGVPTGTVVFSDSGLQVATASVVNGGGTATSTALAIGDRTIRAVYFGNDNFTAGAFNTTTQTVNRADTTVTVTSALNPSIFSQPVAFTATATAVAPGAGIIANQGTFAFWVDGSLLQGGVQLDGAGAATATATSLALGNHTVTATFDDLGGSFNGVTGTLTGGQQVNRADTTTTVPSSLPNPSVFGQAVTLSATVTSTFPGTITGQVQFGVDGLNKSDPATLLPNGTASLSGIQDLSVGSHVITATYTSDGTYATSTGTAAVLQVVNKAGTSTALTSTPNASNADQSVTFTAIVAAVAPGSGTPTGTVTFVADGTQLLGTGDLNSGGVATATFAALIPGTHTVTATYGGSISFVTSTSSSEFNQTVNPFATTTTVTSSIGNSLFGQPVVYTATVIATPVSGPLSVGTPTGTVQFTIDNVVVGGVTLTDAGTASLSVTDTAVGIGHPIVATYLGVTRWATSVSPTIHLTVDQAFTTTTITSAANASVWGQPVSFTATVAANAPGGGTPEGNVVFFIDTQPVGTVPLVGGVATSPSFNNLTVTSHKVQAVYLGNVSYVTSADTLSQAVNKADSTTAVSGTPSPSTFGQAVSFTATVTATAPGVGAPTGAVTFSIDGVALGNAVPLVNGVATSGSTTSMAVGGRGVTATYSGDTHFNGGSGTMTQTVQQASTTTTNVTPSLSPSVFGQPVSFTATVAPVLPGAGVPTGSVTFTAHSATLGDVTIGTSPLSPTGTAVSPDIASFGVGTYAVTATYSGDPSFTSSSGTTTQIVNQAAVSVTVTSAPDPSVFGQMVTFSATATAVAPGAGTPVGNINFTGGGMSQDVALVNGVATVTHAPPVGTSVVTALHSGDGNFVSGATATVTQQVIPANTTTTVTTSGTPSTYTQGVTFTALVAPVVPGAGTPTGNVRFFIDGSAVGTRVTLSQGAGTYVTSLLVPGTHSVTATYSPQFPCACTQPLTNFNTSTSLPISQVVSPIGATNTVTSSTNPSAFGQPVTVTATLTGILQTPTGSIHFGVDGHNVTGSALVGGIATTSLSTTLPVGDHTVTATYSGDGTYTPDTAAITQTVQRAQTSTTNVVSSAPTSVFGQPVSFTATVAPFGPGAGTPSGNVTFTAGTTVVGTTTLSNAGIAVSPDIASLGVGTYGVTATYSGDGSFSTSSGTTTQIVTQALATITVTSSPNPSVHGQMVTFSATVTAVAPGAGTPGGVVHFGGGTLGILAPLVNGVATTTSAGVTTGTPTITAVYSEGDGNFVTGVSNTMTQTVNLASTTTTVSAAPSPSSLGQAVTFTAGVVATPPGAGTPTGPVQFFVDGASIGTSSSSVTTTALAVGTHQVTATYSGDGNFAGSTSAAITTLVVQPIPATNSVISTQTPSVFGQPVQFVATLGGTQGTPTGTVTFSSPGVNLGPSVTLTAGVATSTATALFPFGDHTVTATYSGNLNYLANAGTVTQTVNPAGTTVVVGSSATPSAFGQSVVFIGTVSPVAPGAGVPSGHVAFVIDSGSPISAVLVNGVATTAGINTLGVNSHTVAATYLPDLGNFSTSVGSLTQVVGAGGSSTSISSSQNPSTIGQGVQFTAQVVSSGNGAGTPDGTVQFVVDSVNSGGPVPLSGGSATSGSISSLTLGNHSVTAVYSGSTNFTTSSVTLSGGQTVNNLPATFVTVGSTKNPSSAGDTVVLSASVAPVVGSSSVPGGTVQFVVDGANLGGPVAMSGGAALLPTNALGIGNHTIVANYSGDATFQSSSGTLAGGQTVNLAALAPTSGTGYWLFGADGGVFTFGKATFFGSTGSMALSKPMVAMTATPSGKGYWLFASDGGVFAYGDAGFFGSTGNMHLNAPIVAMASTATGHGYWLFASDGGVFAYGDAGFFGSAGGTQAGSPVVAMAATPSGHGYWLARADGSVATFGDAANFGSLSGQHLNAAIVAMSRTPSGKGYWLVAADGGVFNFGDAPALGSPASAHLNSPVVGFAPNPDGLGYWLGSADGGVFNYGDAPFLGSMGGQHLNKVMIGLTSSG